MDELLTAEFVVAATPLMVRHHLLIRAVPVGAGWAVALIVNTPDIVELLVVVHATVGVVLMWLMVRIVLVAVRFDESVTVTW